MGENIEQLSNINSIQKKVNINGIQLAKSNLEITKLDKPLLINILTIENDMTTLLYGYKNTQSFPLLIQQGNHYVFTGELIKGVGLNYLAEVLHDILPNNHNSEQVAYIRLEDIHPMSDLVKLMEVGEYLNERNIPYMLVVIPVYITPETGERIYYSDSPELVDVLHDLQNTGGTIVAHGYTHHYRESETGEGFEFWDVENDQFIVSDNPKKDVEQILPQTQFSNLEDYLSYISELKEQERDYIDKKMEKSIHELIAYDLYPLAFEAPHYTMSQQGYNITGDYFTAILGQIQLSDEQWKVMGTPPFLTSASFLNDMVLYPETIGYVDPSLPDPFRETERRLNESLIVRDSMIGGFYHSYLGVEYLPQFLTYFEGLPSGSWLDLKQTVNEVKTSNVQIISDGSGNIHTNNDLNWIHHLFRRYEFTPLEKVLWGITAIVLLFVVMFFLFTIYLRSQLKKRLFKERKDFG